MAFWCLLAVFKMHHFLQEKAIFRDGNFFHGNSHDFPSIWFFPIIISCCLALLSLVLLQVKYNLFCNLSDLIFKMKN